MKPVVNKIYNIGADNKNLDLFESQYKVPNGMAYNSFVIMDEKVALFETIDASLTKEWLENLDEVLQGRKIDYLIISHMEPDHSANILKITERYKDVTIVGNYKTFQLMSQFFNRSFDKNILVVKDGDVLSLGNHELQFVFAPMCHWPEVMMTYDKTSKVLFTADAFGKFGASDVEDNWDDEARRYYFNIVGKYGASVQSLLKKVKTLEIETICPLHGVVLHENVAHCVNLYDTWSKYEFESDSVFVAYTSVYGNTKKAVELFCKILKDKGVEVTVADLGRTDMSENLSTAFKCSKIVLATTTYNAGIFPQMEDFLHHLKAKNFQNKTIGLIENGSWVGLAGKCMTAILNSLIKINIVEPLVSIKSSMNDETIIQLENLAKNLMNSHQ